MSSRVSLAAGALAAFGVAIGLWNAWTLAGLQGQVRALEARSVVAPAPPPSPARGVSSGGPTPGLRDDRVAAPGPAPAPKPKAKLDLDDPEVQDRILDRLEENASRREQDLAELRASMQRVAEQFAQEEALDGATRQRLFAELRRRVDGFERIRAQVRSGALPMSEARAQIDSLRSDSDELLASLLGPDDLVRLERALQNERLSAFDPP